MGQDIIARYGIIQGYLGDRIVDVLKRMGVVRDIDLLSLRSLVAWKIAEDMAGLDFREFMEELKRLRESRMIDVIIAEKAEQVINSRVQWFEGLMKRRKW